MSSATVGTKASTRYFRQFSPKSDNIQRGTHAYYCTQAYELNGWLQCWLLSGHGYIAPLRGIFKFHCHRNTFRGIREMSTVKLSLHFGINIGRNDMVNGANVAISVPYLIVH
ncbi:hypothetical protein NPIL_6671 [Nephila pilipes]|uniref:Uncharacterized protein n=1 Tax=Nephila pilipes TaxID=299642 RepID=A0A8X6UD75_NEPPI|nr:hypothetical protein NPIL_6671 [Nephila pilipes]